MTDHPQPGRHTPDRPPGSPTGRPVGHHDMAAVKAGEPAAQGRSRAGHRKVRLGREERFQSKAKLVRPSRITPDLIREAVRRVTDRDRELLVLLQRHRVLTTEQIAALLYDSASRARTRLPTLYRLRLVDRFQPYDPANRNPSYHYVLDRVGAAVLAADHGADPVEAARRHDIATTVGLARSQRLRHLVGTNWIYTALAAHARHDPRARLLAWRTEAECNDWCGDVVRPDAYGQWHEDDTTVEFFLEYDLGTEPLGRLVSKLGGYELLQHERGTGTWVLLTVPGSQREANARRALAAATVPVATAVAGPRTRPQDPVWLPLGQSCPDRVRLAELARLPKPLEAPRRVARSDAHAWRFEDAHADHEEAPNAHA